MVVVPSSASSHVSVTSFDANEIRWAAGHLTSLLQQTTPGSPVEVVLRQAMRELASLRQSANSTVLGPVRVKAA